MTTYVVGDVQGCHRTLLRLLDRIAFRAERDRLWLVGDLVNRGPASLEVLRWAHAQGESLTAVLGNHDLHLLGVAAGVAPPKRRDTLEAILEAPDREPLLEWLRGRPFLHREGPWVLVHAGLLPRWTVDEAEALARGAEELLRGETQRAFLRAALGPVPCDGPEATGQSVLAAIALTRLRTCHADGTMCDEFSGPPSMAPPGCMPWFDVPGRGSASSQVVFGHWAALGVRVAASYSAVDSGCVWGGSLTALRLEDRALFQVPCADPVPALRRAPGRRAAR